MEKKKKKNAKVDTTEISNLFFMRNAHGELPIDIAQRRGNSEVVEILRVASERENGAQSMSTSMTIPWPVHFGEQVNPYASRDLFYTNVKRKGGLKLSFKVILMRSYHLLRQSTTDKMKVSP